MLTGSLETFTSSEVLRLVSGTRKTGVLVVRGTGPFETSVAVDVRVRDGEIVHAAGGSPLASDTVTSLADLLRITVGEFTFDADAGQVPSGTGLDVEQAIADAESILVEWRTLETYVPNLDAAVELAASIDRAVTVEPAQWTTLSAVGTGCSVRDLARITGEGPLATCRSIRALVDLGVLRVLVTDASDAEPTDAAPAVETPEPVVHSTEEPAGIDWADAVADPFETDDDLPADEQHPEFEAVSAMADTDIPLGPDAADLVSVPDVESPVVAERFRNFSPRAAVAMAATESGGAHLAEGEDEPAGRSGLLKFLGSARQSA